MKRAPKHFKVDWIPEADGRDLVKQFAGLISAVYKHGNVVEPMKTAFQSDGTTILVTLYTDPNSKLAIEREDAERLSEQQN
ncbi:MAG TPA: hypothetical protein VFE51_20080 [Verrucomicrobiae bacterium]|nr:hypothetical protein [Verrucomicrobiae bacterium]